MSPRCNAVGCATARGNGALMCRTHWFAVPVLLRRQVNATWRAYLRDRERPKYHDYLQARDEAIRYVAEGEGRLAQFVPDLPRIKALEDRRK